MLPESTIRVAGPAALHYGHIHRWMWLAYPEDCAQECLLTEVEFPHLTEAARRELISYRLRKLRYEIWGRFGARSPRIPSGLRPSKLARRRGYRKDKTL